MILVLGVLIVAVSKKLYVNKQCVGIKKVIDRSSRCERKEVNTQIEHFISCLVEGHIDGAHISGKENCLIRNPIGFAAINCFYDDIGYMCEKKGKLMNYYTLNCFSQISTMRNGITIGPNKTAWKYNTCK